MVHEAQMHQENSFITLTYEHEPESKSINVEHFQKFMKRLRKHYKKKELDSFTVVNMAKLITQKI